MYYLDSDLELVKPKDPIPEVKMYIHHKTDYIIGFTVSQGHQPSARLYSKIMHCEQTSLKSNSWENSKQPQDRHKHLDVHISFILQKNVSVECLSLNKSLKFKTASSTNGATKTE